MISVRQRRALRPEGPASTTAATRSPSSSTSTALVPSTMTAPDSTAHRRMASSSSVRGMALPIGGNDVPGHSSSSSCPKPDNRRPLFVVCDRTHSPRPRRSSSATARGVSPSPQVLSRGKTAESTRTTSRPLRAAHAAAEEPAGPAPMTTMSVSFGSESTTGDCSSTDTLTSSQARDRHRGEAVPSANR